MSDSSSEPPENWQRILAAAKASRRNDGPAPEERQETESPPEEFSRNLVGRVRAFHASLAAWQRWSLLAGLVSLLVFIASLIYLKVTASNEPEAPIIETPGIDLPQPSPSPPPKE